MIKSRHVVRGRTRKPFLDEHLYEKITKEESALILGGDPTPAQVSVLITSLSGIFTQGANCSTQLWQEFNNEIGVLATTNVGYDLLNAIVDNAGGRTINITGNVAGSANGAEYHDNTGSGGSIDLGSLVLPAGSPTDWNYYRQFALNFGSIAHELFHAENFIINGGTQDYATYSTSVGSELDAFLFEAMADIEIDEKRNLGSNDLTKSYMYWDHDLYDSANSPGVVTQSRLDFQTAWYDMFHNKNFTMANYNILSQDFLTASAQGVGYAQFNLSATSYTAQSWSHATIKKFYISDFSQSSYFATHVPLFPMNPVNNGNPPTPPPPDPPPGHENGGSGGSGGGAGDGGYVYVSYNDPGAPNSGGWYYVYDDGGYAGSGGGSTGGDGGGAIGPRGWHYAGALGPVWDDTGVPLTPAELAALALN